MKLLGIFIVYLFANEINGFSDRMCGAKLAQVMWIVCENGFNTMVSKRSDHTDHFNTVLPAIDNDGIYPYGPSSLSDIFQIEQGSLLAKTRRTRMMGIADECCKKSCKYSELAAYCVD